MDRAKPRPWAMQRSRATPRSASQTTSFSSWRAMGPRAERGGNRASSCDRSTPLAPRQLLVSLTSLALASGGTPLFTVLAGSPQLERFQDSDSVVAGQVLPALRTWRRADHLASAGLLFFELVFVYSVDLQTSHAPYTLVSGDYGRSCARLAYDSLDTITIWTTLFLASLPSWLCRACKGAPASCPSVVHSDHR